MLTDEKIELLRGGEMVSSFAGSFGSGLRETRLTAMLGYLIALCPSRFCEKLGFSGKPVSVALELRHGQDRSDVLITTTGGVGIIEAKIDATDPFEQAQRYTARWRVLLTEFPPTGARQNQRRVLYMRWRSLQPILDQLARSGPPAARFVAKDLLLYLQEHHMIPRPESVEVYAREINEEKTLTLFLKCRMYGCTYESGSRVAEALYFAPHFGQAIAAAYPGVSVGISYVAKIEEVIVAESYSDLRQRLAAVRKGPWVRKHDPLLSFLATWEWGQSRHTFLLLGEPRLVFNPAVKKENLQQGTGFLNKRFLSFDALFEAWAK